MCYHVTPLKRRSQRTPRSPRCMGIKHRVFIVILGSESRIDLRIYFINNTGIPVKYQSIFTAIYGTYFRTGRLILGDTIYILKVSSHSSNISALSLQNIFHSVCTEYPRKFEHLSSNPSSSAPFHRQQTIDRFAIPDLRSPSLCISPTLS